MSYQSLGALSIKDVSGIPPKPTLNSVSLEISSIHNNHLGYLIVFDILHSVRWKLSYVLSQIAIAKQLQNFELNYWQTRYGEISV